MSVLDAAALLAQAQTETGLSDFGDDSLPERVGVLIGKFREAGMGAAGEQIGADVALGLLRQGGGVVTDALFVIDLPDLGGAQRLRDADVTVTALLDFAGH